MKILLIDDDISIIELLSSWLIDLYPQAIIQTVFNGHDGFKALTNDPDIKLVILDYDMPDISGVDLLKKINALPNHPLPKFIMLTGAEDEEVAAESFRKGVSDYLPKRKIGRSTLKKSLEFVLSSDEEE